MGRDLSVIGRAIAAPARAHIVELPMDGTRRPASELAHARLCYDHLAGRLGVGLTDALVTLGWLDDDLRLADAGADGFARLGMPTVVAAGSRRPLTRACADWTEQRPHLAGALGASVGEHFLEQDWIRRRATGRGLDVTPRGVDALLEHWGFTLELA